MILLGHCRETTAFVSLASSALGWHIESRFPKESREDTSAFPSPPFCRFRNGSAATPTLVPEHLPCQTGVSFFAISTREDIICTYQSCGAGQLIAQSCARKHSLLASEAICLHAAGNTSSTILQRILMAFEVGRMAGFPPSGTERDTCSKHQGSSHIDQRASRRSLSQKRCSASSARKHHAVNISLLGVLSWLSIHKHSSVVLALLTAKI